jgi:hypothetical protein
MGKEIVAAVGFLCDRGNLRALVDGYSQAREFTVLG